MEQKTMDAEPYELEFDPKKTALLIIDMQRDFVDPGRIRRGAGQRRDAAAGDDRADAARAGRCAQAAG